MEYETVPLQQLLREIAGRTASEHDADAIRLAAYTLDELERIHGEIVDTRWITRRMDAPRGRETRGGAG